MTMVSSSFQVPTDALGVVRLPSTHDIIIMTKHGFKIYVEGLLGGKWQPYELDPMELGLQGRKDDLEAVQRMMRGSADKKKPG